MCCFIPISSTYIFGTLLTANGNLKQLNLMASTGMLLNIVLNFILIPKMSAKGAAISSIVTQSFTALAQVLMAQKEFGFRKNYRLLSLIALFIASCIGINIFFSNLNFNWILRIVLAVFSCFSVAFLTKLISIRNIYRIVKYEE
jgi:O-antigen/teichoic acid export membrane protein